MTQVLTALNRLVNTLLGGRADETISARAYRDEWYLTVVVINWLFNDPGHCVNAHQRAPRRPDTRATSAASLSDM